MKKIFSTILMLLLLASTAWGFEIEQAQNTIAGDMTVTGVLGSNEAAMTGDCTASVPWTLGAQWTCTGGVATKAGAGTSTLAVTTTPIEVNKWYKLAVNITRTAGSIVPSAGGNTMATISATDATYQSYFYATATTTLTFTPSTDFAGSVQTVVLSEVSSATTVNDAYFTATNTKQPLMFKRTLSNAIGNETAYHFAYQTNKAAGDDYGVVIDQLDTVSGGTSYLFDIRVGGTSKFKIDNNGITTLTNDLTLGANNFTCALIRGAGNDTTLTVQSRNYTVADSMLEMTIGTTTFTGFDGEIIGVNIMPTVGVLDDGDTMTLLKLSPTGTPASTLGILNGLAFGNWGGTGTDTAYMVNLLATGYDYLIYDNNFSVTDAGVVTAVGFTGPRTKATSAISCVTTVCTDVAASEAIYITTTGTDTMTVADGTVTGQERFFSHKVDGGQITITPTNFSAGTSMTMTDAGDTMLIHWNGTKWDMVVFYGGILNP